MEEGQERYIIKIETEGGQEVIQIYDQVEKRGVKANEALDDAAKKVAKDEIASAKEVIKANEEKMAAIRKQYDTLEKQIAAKNKTISRLSGGTTGEKDLAKARIAEVEALKAKQAELDREAQKYGDEIESSTRVIAELERHLDVAVEKQTSMRTELRNAREEAAMLLAKYRAMSDEEKKTAEGKALAQKIDELTQKAGNLKDAIDDINRSTQAQASDTHTFSAISEGLDSVISAYGIAQGAAVAFGASEQELMEMQTKFQAVLAASNSVKTIQNNLQKESNLLIAVGNVQKWAEAKAEAAATSATIGHTIAQKAFNVVAKANPYVLLATAALSVVGAIALVVKATNSAKEAQQRQAEAAKRSADEMKKNAERQKHIANTIGESTANLVGNYKVLQAQFKNLRTEAEKKRWVEENKSAFNQLGLSVNGVNDAYNVLIKDAPKVIEALKSIAEAEAMKELYQESLKKKYKSERTKPNTAKWEVANGTNITDEEAEAVGVKKETKTKSNGYGGYDIEISYSQEAIRKVNEYRKQKAIDALNAQNKKAQEETDSEVKYFEEKYDQAIKKVNESKANVPQFTPKNDEPKTTKEKANEMISTLNDGSKAWFENVISKLREELQNTPKYFDGALNPEYEQVEKEIKRWEELFEKAFGDNAKLLKDLLDEFGTVEQRRAATKAEFAKKRDSMVTTTKMGGFTNRETYTFRDGFSQGNLDELNQQEQEALNAIDEAFAQKQASFQDWMITVSEMTLQQLEDTLKKAQEELANAESGGDSNRAAIARVKVAQAQERIKKERANQKVGVDKKDVNSWNDLYRVLVDCSKEFDEIGDLVGGLAGDIIKAAGKIATSTVNMINVIQTLAKDSVNATKDVAEGAKDAMETAEKSSAILTAISAAMQVVSVVMGFISQSSTKKSYEKAQKVYEGTVTALDWAIDKQLEYASTLAGKEAQDAYDKAIKMAKSLSSAARQLGKQYLNSGASATSHSSGVENYRNVSSSAWMSAAKALNMSVGRLKEVMGDRMTGLFNLSVEQLQKLKSDASSFYASLDEETRSYWDSIIEREAEVADILDQQISDITKLNKGELADSWSSMLADMSTTGKDFADDFNKMLSEAITNSIVNSKYGKKLEEIRNKLADGLADGTLSAEEATKLRSEYSALATEAMKDARESLKNAGISELTDQSSNRSVAASVTQETMDEVNGRLTMVQVNMQTMVSIGQLSQANLANIERYTSYLPAMARDIANMRDDIADKL